MQDSSQHVAISAASQRQRPLIIGLTGGIGAGKSTVAAEFERQHCRVVDVDKLGRDVLAPGGAAVESVARRFGSHLIGSDGGILRSELAAIVFHDPDALSELTAVSHPVINEELRRIAASAHVDDVLVFDLAVLAESDLGKGIYGPVVVVTAPLEVRLHRLEGRGMTPEDAQARMANQLDDEERNKLADFVIDNTADLNAWDDTTSERSLPHQVAVTLASCLDWTGPRSPRVPRQST